MLALMRTRLLWSVGLLIGLVTTAQPAHAVLFDFVAYAAGNEHGATSETITEGGITVTVSGRDLSGSTQYLAYFDDRLQGGEPGGLGVCKSLGGGGECDPDIDDNLSLGEVLVLAFSSPVVITSMELSNGDHVDLYTGNFGFATDSTPTTIGAFSQMAADAVVTFPGFASKWNFISNETISGIVGETRKMYISKINVTSVPEPASLALLALGALGFGARRRRTEIGE